VTSYPHKEQTGGPASGQHQTALQLPDRPRCASSAQGQGGVAAAPLVGAAPGQQGPWW